MPAQTRARPRLPDTTQPPASGKKIQPEQSQAEVGLVAQCGQTDAGEERTPPAFGGPGGGHERQRKRGVLAAEQGPQQRVEEQGGAIDGRDVGGKARQFAAGQKDGGVAAAGHGQQMEGEGAPVGQGGQGGIGQGELGRIGEGHEAAGVSRHDVGLGGALTVRIVEAGCVAVAHDASGGVEFREIAAEPPRDDARPLAAGQDEPQGQGQGGQETAGIDPQPPGRQKRPGHGLPPRPSSAGSSMARTGEASASGTARGGQASR